ncbi:hypothetical protein PGSY75_0001600B, partial [Plasmodium gaboni]
YLLYLFNKNNHIYFVLHLLFKNDILLQRNINMSYKNNIYNNIYNMYNISSVLNYKNDILNNTHNLYNIYDLFALFIFYVHIKRFYFDFFLLILKRINNIERTNEHHNVGDMNNMCDMNNMSDINNIYHINNICDDTNSYNQHIYHISPYNHHYNIHNVNHQYMIKFLNACMQLKNIISNIININKTKKEKKITNHHNHIRTYRINYFRFIKNAIFKKYKIISTKEEKKKKKKKKDEQIYIKAYIHNGVYKNIYKNMLCHNIKEKKNNNNIIQLFNNNIIKKKYFHFFFLKKQKYKIMTYHKFKKRKDLNTLIMCDKYINKSIRLFLNNFQDTSIFIKYMKIVKKANIINYSYDDHIFINSIRNFLKKKRSYFKGQDLIFICKWQTHMNNMNNMNNMSNMNNMNNMNNINHVNHINNMNNIHSVYIKTNSVDHHNIISSISLIKDDIFQHIEDYNFHHIKDIIYICSKNKLYEYKLFDKIINYIINNINNISSKHLVRIIILMYNKLNYKNELKKLLFILLNNYRPSLKKTNKRNHISINNIYLENINKKYVKKNLYIYNICKKNNVDSMNKHDAVITSNQNNILFRSFQHVKVHKLLLFINILIKSNIYINYEWSFYFLSLIKQKYIFIKKKGFYVLCYILFHIQNNNNICKSFEDLFNPYNIYKKFTLSQILNTSNIYSLIYVAFLYNNTYNTTHFIKIFFTVIQKFYDTCMTTQTKRKKNNYQHISCNEYINKNYNSEYYIQDDDNNILFNYSYNEPDEKNHFIDDNIFIHDLKFYERNINNKYQKKKDKKKKHAFKNKINLIDIPLVCNNIKDNFSLDPYVNNIKKYETTSKVLPNLMYINNLQEFQNKHKDYKLPHILNNSIIYTHMKNNTIINEEKNNNHINNHYYNHEEKEINKSYTDHKFETINNYNIYIDDLFNRIHKSRLILILIYHFLF